MSNSATVDLVAFVAISGDEVLVEPFPALDGAFGVLS